MPQEILNYIKTQRVCVLAVEMLDGSPHAATVHYSHVENPLRFFIQTSNTTTKAKSLISSGGAGKAAIVIGFSETDWLTLQMRGNIRVISNQKKLDGVYKIHYAKHPDAKQYKGPNTVFLEFQPNWWRFTDFNTNPEKITENQS